MDPLVALGVAGNIVSFVEFTITLVTETSNIYNSVSGTTRHVSFLHLVAQDISRFIDSFPAQDDQTSEALRSLVGESKRIASKLLEAIHSLASSNKKSKWNSFRAALKQVYSKEKLDSLFNELRILQSRIESHIQFSIL
jgi:hypothetical protein